MHEFSNTIWEFKLSLATIVPDVVGSVTRLGTGSLHVFTFQGNALLVALNEFREACLPEGCIQLTQRFVGRIDDLLARCEDFASQRHLHSAKQVEVSDGKVRTVGWVVQLSEAKLLHLGLSASSSMRPCIVPQDEWLLAHDAALAQNRSAQTACPMHDHRMQ